MRRKKGENTYWGIDSEFLMSGRKNCADDVHSIQFSDGSDNHFFIETKLQLERFFERHNKITKMYAFNLDVEVGSLRAMLGESYSTHKEANELGAIKFSKMLNRKVCEINLPHLGFHCFIYDIQGLCTSLNFKNLASLGDELGFPKDAKPEALGIRKWHTPEEKEIFVKYALRDAEITSKAARMLYERWGIDPEKYASSGTIAKDEFQFPRRLKMVIDLENELNSQLLRAAPSGNNYIQLGKVAISPLENRVRLATFGGRSECYKTGFIPGVYYNDVKSLYPLSMLATRCFQIVDAVPCSEDDLDLTGKLSRADQYGWIDGYFESNNDLWGLPIRGTRNHYQTGRYSGLFHTFDLIAAKAKVLDINACYRPKWSLDPQYHNKLSKMFFAKINGGLSDTEKIFNKAVMNSASGKLGQGTSYSDDKTTTFPSACSNFFAYSTLLAHSHMTMSRLYDLFQTAGRHIYYTDTDSVMSDADMSGVWFYYSDGVNNLPVELSVKAKGDLSLFRAKRYILDPNSKEGYASHGWRYGTECFLKLRYGDVDNMLTRISVKSTALTRTKDALDLELGRWKSRPVTLTRKKISELVWADDKRDRGNSLENYNSYQLVAERRNVDSKAWSNVEAQFKTTRINE